MSQLDTHPDNELGKGILDPATEARLIDRGIVFATRRTVVLSGSKSVSFLITSKRPYAEVLNTPPSVPMRTSRPRRQAVTR